MTPAMGERKRQDLSRDGGCHLKQKQDQSGYETQRLQRIDQKLRMRSFILFLLCTSAIVQSLHCLRLNANRCAHFDHVEQLFDFPLSNATQPHVQSVREPLP